MEAADWIERVHGLTDLELAMLLCLMAKQNCIIEYEQGHKDPLEQELQLVRLDASGNFRVSAKVPDRLLLMSSVSLLL